MKHILIFLACLVQSAYSSDWKIESTKAEPYVHSQTKGVIKITISITNTSEKIQSVAEEVYPSLKGYLRPQTYLFNKNETLPQLKKRNPFPHYSNSNSGVCHELNLIKIAPGATVNMVMYDNEKNIGRRLLLCISSHIPYANKININLDSLLKKEATEIEKSNGAKIEHIVGEILIPKPIKTANDPK